MSNKHDTTAYRQGDIIDIVLVQDDVQYQFSATIKELGLAHIIASPLTGDIEAVEQLVLDQQLEQSVSVQSDITSQLLLIEAELWSKIAREHVSAEFADDIADAYRQRYLGDK